jgi:hypothetical protein
LRDRLETENKFLAANALDSNGRKKSSARAQTKQYQSVCLYLRFIQTKQFVCFSISFKRNLSLSVSLFHSNEISGCVSLTLSLSLCFIHTKSIYVFMCVSYEQNLCLSVHVTVSFIQNLCLSVHSKSFYLSLSFTVTLSLIHSKFFCLYICFFHIKSPSFCWIHSYKNLYLFRSVCFSTFLIRTNCARFLTVKTTTTAKMKFVFNISSP